MELQPSTLQHLAFIKHLYRLGMRQSETSWPLSSAALLNFHDAVESFLHLSCLHLNLRTKNPTFDKYWEELKSHFGMELSQAAAMAWLN
jgi:hypothetical protein